MKPFNNFVKLYWTRFLTVTSQMLLVTLLTQVPAYADDLSFEADDLGYSVITGTNNVTVIGPALGSEATEITIPETVENSGITYNVTTIGDSAFMEIALTSLIVGNNVTTIGDYAFTDNALTSLTIGDSVATIGDYAFYRNLLTSLTIPDGVTTIGEEAFSFNSLTSLTIPGSVTTIGDYAFADNLLESLFIGDGAATITLGAFYNNALTNVAFEGDFGTFDLNMFDVNPNLDEITYCVGSLGWGESRLFDVNNGVAFVTATSRLCPFDLNGLSYSIVTGTENVIVTGRAEGNDSTEITIPETVENSGITYNVTTIGDSAFSENALTSLTIPDTVTTIGPMAFAGNGLTSLIIPESVVIIQDYAFVANALTSLTIPDSVMTIEKGVFANNKLISLTIGGGVTSIDIAAFSGNALTSLTIPTNVAAIGYLAFVDNALTNVAFEGDFGTFDLNMFGANLNLDSITYCNGTGDWLGDFNVGTVEAPVLTTPTSRVCTFDFGGLSYSIVTGTENVIVTGRAVGNDSTEITIPGTVENNEITYSVTAVGKLAFDYDTLTSLTISDGVTTIGDLAFYANSLESLAIPDSVTSIGSFAFADNDFTSLTIGDSVTTIGSFAFGLNELTNLTFEGDFGDFELDMLNDNLNLTAITRCTVKMNWPQTFKIGSFDGASYDILVTSVVCPFDLNGLSYSIVTGTENVIVTGRAEGNESTEIVIPGTVDHNGITYNVTAVGESAFAGNGLTSLTIGDNVATIGEGAFAANALTSVIIPDSVTSMGAGAFVSNGLSSLTIGDGLTTIGEGAFAYNALTSLTIGRSVATIGEGAFANNALTSVIIPDSVTSMGAWSFVSNDLSSLTIGDGLTTIGEGAFAGNAFTSLTIGDSVATIGEGAFAGNALTSLTIGDSVATIGRAAFANNVLTSLVIPDSVMTIDAYGFGMNALSNVAFEGDVGTFDLNMFDANLNLDSITYCNGTGDGWGDFNVGTEEAPVLTTPTLRVCTFDFGGLSYSIVTGTENVIVTGRAEGNDSTEITIPGTVENNEITYSVTAVGDFAFDYDTLVSLSISEGVTTIGASAFYSNSLESLAVPDSVTSIGSFAFADNDLTSLTIPDSVTTIGDFAFGLNELTSVAFGGNFGTFDLGMFSYNPDLADITYCDDTENWVDSFNIGTEEVPIPNTPAARVCPFDSSGLSYSVIAETGNVTVTGRAEGNDSTEITIPETVENNGITYNVTTIAEEAFSDNALTSLTIGDSVTTIGSAAFAGNALTSVIIPDSVTSMGAWSFVSNDLSSLTIGDGLTTIGDYAFPDNALTSLIVGNNVATIGEAAFAANALTSVIIPDSVMTIKKYAFAGNALSDVAFEGDFGTFDLTMFYTNLNLDAITYCEDKDNWPQTFDVSSYDTSRQVEATLDCINGSTGNLDLDGNGRYDALTDGLLLLRGMFGLTGDALIAGAVAVDATYTTAEEIQSRFTALGDQVDIDGDGNVDALTDGLLVLRSLFGLNGDTMIAGVVAEGATRASALQLEGYLETLVPPLP